MKKIFPLFTMIMCLGYGSKSQNTVIPKEMLDKGFEEFYQLLSLPNDAHYPEQVAANVAYMERAFTQRDFQVQRLETETSPLLLASKYYPGNTQTVLVYLQVDGQPVDPSFWYQEDPFKPVLKTPISGNRAYKAIEWEQLYSENLDPEWRIFARSTADSKGAIVMFMTALDMLVAKGKKPVCNLKVIMDFEEEISSPSFAPAVRQYREALAADMLLILDGPRHISNQPTLTFGARGIADLTLTTYGPIVPQHSGHYGNYAPNPALILSKLLASMKDEQGRVVIPGFYNGIELDEETRQLLAGVPDNEAQIQRKIGIAFPDQVAPTYQESLQYPSLNIRGMSSGWVGDKVRTIVPSTATAEIDIRFVPETDPLHLIQLVTEHIEKQGFYITDKAPTGQERLKHPRIVTLTSGVGYMSFRTDVNSVAGRWLRRALTKEFGSPPVIIRNAGGSIPLAPVVNELGIPAVLVPTVNRDNNQHSPNENIRVGNFIDGIRTNLAYLTTPIQ
ncbi:MAG: M20/M25/M40 family metallo-hydrolase [Bacteroidota bacterium]